MDRRIRRGDLPALRECLALLGRNNALAHHDITRLCAGDTRRQRRITDALTLHGCISVPKYGAECHFVKGAATDYARVYEILEKEAKGAWKERIKAAYKSILTAAPLIALIEKLLRSCS